MPTEIYTAPAASSKTQFAIDLARSHSLTVQRVRVVVASSGQQRMWKQRLARAGGALGIEVMIVDQLVTHILAEAGDSWTQLSEPVQYRLIRTILGAMELDYYNELRFRPGFVDVVQQLIPVLKAAQITPAKLRVALDALSAEPRLTELAQVFTIYEQMLEQNGWSDRDSLQALALQALTNTGSTIGSDWPLLILDGFADFIPAELAIFEALCQRVKRTVVMLTQPVQQEKMARHKGALKKLKTLHPEIIESLPHPLEPSPLKTLSNGIFDRAELETTFAGEMSLIEATDRPTEVRAALRWLKQQMVQDGLAPADCALLARDIGAYRPFIEQIGREFGLPIRIEQGLLLNQAPIIDGLLALLKLHLPNAPLERRQVVNVWRSPWFDWRQAGLENLGDWADELDTLGRQQRVIGGHDQWNEAFETQSKLDAEIRIEQDGDYEEGTAGNAGPVGSEALKLKQLFEQFLTRTAPPHSANRFADYVQWFEGLIGQDDAEDDEATHSLGMVFQARTQPETEAAAIAALTRLKDVLRGLVWADGALGTDTPIDFESFFNELSGAVNSAVFNFPVAKGSKPIVATSINSARGLNWRVVALLGMSEGEFPRPIGDDPFLRDADRKAINEVGGFELEMATQSRERELFYEAISRPTDKLLLTRPVIADNGAEWVASPFWTEVRKKTAIEPKRVTADQRLRPDEAASETEWLEAIAVLGDTQFLPQEIAQAGKILQQRAASVENQPIHPETGGYNGQLAELSSQLAEQFGPNHVWSASRLENLRKCGMFFFVSSVLKVESRPEPQEGMDVAQTGTLYHEIFEVAYTRGIPETENREEMRAFITEIAEPILADAPAKQGFRETQWWSQTKTDIINHVTDSVLSLAGDGWTFYQAEAAFGMQGNPSLILQKDDDRLQMRGFIDRVDRNAAGELRIIDYKLGGKTNFSEKAFQKGEKLQLPLYALAVEHALRLGTVSDGFYFHFKKAEKSGMQLAKYGDEPHQAAESAVAHAWEAVEQARAGNFKPTPPSGGCPSYCPAAQWCWQYKSAGW